MTSLAASNPARQPLVCTGCGADDNVCAVKSCHGGKLCCPACTHVVVTSRRIPKGEPV